MTFAGLLSAQTTTPGGWVPTSPTVPTNPTVPASPTGASGVFTRKPVVPVTQTETATTTEADESTELSASDFVIDGVPYAKVLYLEGNVWIRAEDETSFHALAEDEPIAAHSVIYTGANGTLDFATGPGMAVRMVPLTVVRIATLPDEGTLTKPTTTAPEATIIALKKGTVFSALGRSDSQPINYQVRTPEGVAGARGTMFATTATDGQSEVSMLHGTVHFQTPDNQSAQIAAGESQQISGTAGGKYLLGRNRLLAPERSDEFFNHAGGLLEHASGYGVVRRGLGPEVAQALRARGYALPAAMQQRFQNAARMHFLHRRPAFRRLHPAGAGASAASNYHPALAPANRPANPPENRLAPAQRPGEAPMERDRFKRRETSPDPSERKDVPSGD